MRNSKIVALVATAALLVLGAAFTSFAAQYNWYEQDGQWRCKNAQGDDYYAAWAKSGADVYWLDDEGYMAVETLVDDDTKYVDAAGKMVKNDWVKLSDDEGNEYWNYFQAGGKKLVGKDEGPKPVTVNGKKYIFDTEGKMLSGWVQEGYGDAADDDYAWQTGIYYCGDEDDGAVTYGWRKIECFNEAEDFVDNNYWFWFGINGKKFAAEDDGSDNALLKEKTINGKKYAFDEHGVMKAEWEQTVDTRSSASTNAGSYAFFQDAEIGAKFANGWFQIVPPAAFDEDNNEDDTAKWFYAKSGKLYQNVIKTINGKKYGFNMKGEMVAGLCAVDLDSTAVSGIFLAEGIDAAEDLDKYVNNAEAGQYDIYYFSADEEKDGSMKTGLQTLTVDGDEYNFYFSTKSGTKGLAFTGKQGNKFYYNGNKVAANDEIGDYVFFEATSVDSKLKPNKVDARNYKEISGLGNKVDASDWALISKTGVVATSGTKKDGNGYKAIFRKATTEYPGGYWEIVAE